MTISIQVSLSEKINAWTVFSGLGYSSFSGKIKYFFVLIFFVFNFLVYLFAVKKVLTEVCKARRVIREFGGLSVAGLAHGTM